MNELGRYINGSISETGRYVGTVDETGTLSLDASAQIQIPSFCAAPAFSLPDLAGVQVGAITLPQTIVTPTFSVPNLGVGGSIAMPQFVVAPTFALPELLGLQSGVIVMPVTSPVPTFNPPDLYGVQAGEGYIVMPSFFAAPYISLPILIGLYSPPVEPPTPPITEMYWADVPAANEARMPWSSVRIGISQGVKWNKVPTAQ